MRPGRLSSIAYRHMSRDLLTTPARRIPAFSPRVLRALVFLSVAASIAGCAQQPTGRGGHSREYFPSSIYGAASERVVGEGEAVPRGGGQYLVGRPYTIAGKRYFPTAQPHESQIGMASYYGAAFHGRRTANGEVFDRDSITAATLKINNAILFLVTTATMTRGLASHVVASTCTVFALNK